MSTIASRLKEIRKSLGQNQDEFCESVGVSRKTQSDYENGRGAPDSAYLLSLYQKGIDIGYILTGQRSVTLDDLVELQRCLFEVEDWLERHQKTLTKEQTLNVAKQLFRAKQTDININEAKELILKTAVGF
ncbi:helix-turn-helix domain-containing protein [Pelistega sp. MC2]|uniref:helix-turn-helix domain-containing protein n=1 Tax=Pelistega sp. MC2 TaxID=1720297 RepID=UPI0008D9EA34|nr:helix-turn-helix transcriptional regulator [Pelistega sp. MC2]